MYSLDTHTKSIGEITLCWRDHNRKLENPSWLIGDYFTFSLWSLAFNATTHHNGQKLLKTGHYFYKRTHIYFFDGNVQKFHIPTVLLTRKYSKCDILGWISPTVHLRLLPATQNLQGCFHERSICIGLIGGNLKLNINIGGYYLASLKSCSLAMPREDLADFFVVLPSYLYFCMASYLESNCVFFPFISTSLIHPSLASKKWRVSAPSTKIVS